MKFVYYLLFIFCFLSIVVSAQERKTMNDKQNLKVVTNQEPYYPKGDAVLYDFVNRKLEFSDLAKRNKLSGNISVSFDVKADSSIVNVLVIEGIDGDIDNQIKKIVEQLKFAPAVQNGFVMKMNMMMNFPISAH
jgi:hypothetical protein